MIKRRILSTVLASTIIVLSFASQAMASASMVEPDGSTGGVFVKTIDGKNIMNYPVSDEVKQLQQKKTTMADLHFNLRS